MNIEDKIDKIEKRVERVKSENESIAYSIVKDYQRTIKMLILIIVILCIMLGGLGIYTVWLLNDIEVVETTTEEYNQDINDTGDINDSNIVNGGDING